MSDPRVIFRNDTDASVEILVVLDNSKGAVDASINAFNRQAVEASAGEVSTGRITIGNKASSKNTMSLTNGDHCTEFHLTLDD